MAQTQFVRSNNHFPASVVLFTFLLFIFSFTALASNKVSSQAPSLARESAWSSATYDLTPTGLLIANIHTESEPKSLPSETTKLPAHIDLKLIGQASFSYLFWDVYDSYLFGPAGAVFGTNFGNNFTSNQASKGNFPLSLVITYKRDIKANDLIDSTKEQWQHLGIPPAQFDPYLPTLKQWPNLSKGDELALVVYADFSVFFYNRKFLALQDDRQFGFDFISIWLSPKTSEPKLRKKLLGFN
jgi:hypothetical protein